MRRTHGNRWKYLWMAVLVAGSIAALGAYRLFSVSADRPAYLTTTVQRGDIVRQVAATGTLQAVTTVQVGTQVSGTISELHADFNSKVRKGQLLAKLDPALFRAQVEQQAANVDSADATVRNSAAGVLSARANLEKARVDVLDKQRKLQRQKGLFEEKLIPQDDLDTAQAALDAAIATRQATEAQLNAATAQWTADQARLVQAKAALENARVNLEHTVILSPIAGTIISRSIDLGQTVAASFSAPTLFTIAADLTRMQVNTNIDEADVGRIREGMDASFSVDAYPGDEFRGRISQVRLASSTVQNVVTYNAIIDVENPRLLLKPGMTANVRIVIDRADAVLKVPNAGLRFKPDMTPASLQSALKRSGLEDTYAASQSAGPRGPAPNGRGAGAGRGNRRSLVWVLGIDQAIRPVAVRLGLTDGVSTALVEGPLKEGDRVVTGVTNDTNRAAAAVPTRPPGFGGPGFGGRR